MSKHTAGPWTSPIWHGDEETNAKAEALGIRKVPALANDGSRFVVAPSGRVALVDCKTAYKRGTGHQTECAERDANAALIAAAPDLLAALELIEKRMVREAAEAFELSTNEIDCLEIARAAIAKAKGQQ